MRKLLLLLLLTTNCYAMHYNPHDKEWKCLTINETLMCNPFMIPVPHGWIVKNVDKSEHESIAFVPDEKHQWRY